MLSHAIPSVDCAPAPSPSAAVRLKRACSRAEGLPGGSISFEFHPPLRRQGADLDPGLVPSGADEGRLRRRLRLSVAGRAGARLRRQRADRGDRFASADNAALFAGPRRLCDCAFGHERGVAPGRGGPGLFRGAAEDGVGARLRGGVRGAEAQVPDFGADALSWPYRTGARVVALVRSPSASGAGEALNASSDGQLELVEARFGELDEVAKRLGVDAVDGVVLDIGVSSMQLDEAARGFSLRFDAPLDMRMGSSGRSAADILRDEDEATIADILFHFGEERAARRIARAIVADREAKPFT